MVRVGCHVSIAGSIDKAVDRAVERTCDTFQIFTGNPRGWKVKPLDPTAVARFREKVGETGMDPVVAHMPYLPNLGSPKPEVWDRSLEAMVRELERCDALGIPFLVTHLGSHLGAGIEEGRMRLADGINRALAEAAGETMLLLENTAGTQNSIGGSFEDIRRIRDGIDEKSRIGICFDTCHAFAAGYDLRTTEAVAETFAAFERVFDPSLLRVIHLNDCRGELGSRLDRHEHIGLGTIGEDGIRAVLHHPDVRDLPLICETPVDERRDDAGNIERIRALAES